MVIFEQHYFAFSLCNCKKFATKRFVTLIYNILVAYPAYQANFIDANDLFTYLSPELATPLPDISHLRGECGYANA